MVYYANWFPYEIQMLTKRLTMFSYVFMEWGDCKLYLLYNYVLDTFLTMKSVSFAKIRFT